ncbi:MAG: radical SAM protein [Patescibacteria group bacterium]|nr:radical SAM protein [Patescibacteria group bacterium]
MFKSSSAKANQSSSDNNDLILLRPGLFYNKSKDSYIFKSSYDESSGPISIGLQVTRQCNAKCIQCAASEAIKDLSTKDLLTVIEKLHKGGAVRISVTGGEPLIRDDIEIILKKIHELGMVSTLSTNGLLLDEKKLEEIRPFLNNIRFSLHGLKQTNDYIFQKKGAFDTIIKSIRISQQGGLETGIFFTAMKTNIDELFDLVELLEKEKVKKLVIYTLMSAGRAKKIFSKEFIHSSELEEQMQQINDLKKRNNWNIDVTLVNWRKKGQCLLVDPQGNLFAYDYSFKNGEIFLGNLFRESLNDLWNEYPYKRNYLEYYCDH